MYCSKCGKPIGDECKYCSSCGEAVSTAIASHVLPATAPMPAQTIRAVTDAVLRDPTKLTAWLKRFLYASIAIDAAGVYSNALQYQLLLDFSRGIYATQALAVAAADVSDRRQQIIGSLQFAISIATVVLFCMWIYRANSNSRALGARNMKFTPGWSVGYYFIPVLNLWRPYQAMKEIWMTSRNPNDWESESRGRILPWWWFLFLLAGVLGNASFRASLRSNEIDELIALTGMMIASDLANIFAACIALVLVLAIHRMQMSQITNLN